MYVSCLHDKISNLYKFYISYFDILFLNEKIQIIEGKIQDLEKQIKFIRYIEQYGIIPIPINEKEKNITYKEYIKKITS